jgi:hypothetical protein
MFRISAPVCSSMIGTRAITICPPLYQQFLCRGGMAENGEKTTKKSDYFATF